MNRILPSFSRTGTCSYTFLADDPEVVCHCLLLCNCWDDTEENSVLPRPRRCPTQVINSNPRAQDYKVSVLTARPQLSYNNYLIIIVKKYIFKSLFI
jgi:hypothetical protein